MKNAHLRFGHLSYVKVFKKSTTHFKVPLDRFIGEPEASGQMKAHLISVIGGDTQIAALTAAIANQDWFTIHAPDGASFRAMLGTNAECYRGSLLLDEGKRRTLRHVVAVSAELAQLNTNNCERAILAEASPPFVWASLAYLYGVPGTSDWSEWIHGELRRMNAIKPLVGIGCNPILIEASKGLLMNCVSRGVREGKLAFPETNGPVEWKCAALSQLLSATSGI